MPQALSYPGVYIAEAPSSVHTIVGVPTAITAFVGAAARGPINEPTTIQSPADYAKKFGGDGTSPLDRAITLFFQNGGGDAVVVRVGAATGPNPSASVTIAGVTVNAASPGAWGNGLTYAIDQGSPAQGVLSDPLFNLTITSSGQPQTSETFSRVSTDSTSPRSLARVLASSNLVTVGPPAPPPSGGPAPTVSASGLVTAKPVAFTGANKTDSALKEADLVASYPSVVNNNTFFNLLVLTPVGGATDVAPATLAAAADFAHLHRAMLIADAPAGWRTVDGAVAGRDAEFFQPFGSNGRENAAVYFPRLELTDADGNAVPDVAPSGAVAGLYAATDTARGVWKAPAGIAVQISGASDLAISMSDFDNGRLNPLAVNCLRSLPVLGDVVWGARTMSGDDQSASQWKYIPVRRLALYIEESLYRGTQWVVFEPNDEPLWAQVRLNIGAFMHGLFRQGAFAGQTAKDAYFVQCDKNTNPQADIDNGILNVVVGFAPLKPAEFVVITIQQITGDIQV